MDLSATLQAQNPGDKKELRFTRADDNYDGRGRGQGLNVQARAIAVEREQNTHEM